MDLFGFAKDIGRRLFNKDEDAAEKIQEHIEANNPGVKNLEVEYERGIVSLCGDCESVEAREKTILMAGNTKGVIDVQAQKLTAPAPKVAQASAPAAGPATAGQAGDAKTADAAPARPAAPKTEFYLIKSGDTLSKIAREYYGDAMAYMRIFEANREVIQDPDKIFVGQKIRIPLD